MARKNEKNLSLYAKHYLKSEIGRKLVRLNELADKLEIEPAALSNKIARGSFSAGFFLDALQALGNKEIPIPAESSKGYDLFKDL